MQDAHTYRNLIDACKSNDRKAQEQLYRTFFAKVLPMVQRYTRDEDQVISILNDGFLKVFKKIDTYTYEGSFEGWIRRVIFSSLSDYFRKENRYLKFLIFDDHDQQFDANAEQNLYYQDILDMTQMLPPKTREVFRLYAIEGYGHREIAELLSMPEGTSKWHLSEARSKLQALINQRKFVRSDK